MLTLKKYCVTIDLEANTEKTKVLKIRKAARLCHYDRLTYRNTLLEFENSFIYLGVILQTNAYPNKHLKHLRRKALVGTNTLSMKIDLAKVQVNTARTLFETIILPSAIYFLEMFGEKLAESVMQRHIKILHSIFFTRDWRESQEGYRQNNCWPEFSKMTFLDYPIPTNLTEIKSVLTIAMDVIIYYVTLWDVTRLEICPTLANAYVVVPRYSMNIYWKAPKSPWMISGADKILFHVDKEHVIDRITKRNMKIYCFETSDYSLWNLFIVTMYLFF